MWQTYLVVALVAYLLGSIPFGYILVKLFLKQDIRQTGSGNIGATNVARSGKKGLAIATLLLDAAKGTTAVFVCTRIAGCAAFSSVSIECLLGRPGLFSAGGATRITLVQQGSDLNPMIVASCLSAVFAILGHMFPLWLRFRGGKGVATALGAFIVLSPTSVAFSFAVFLATFLLTRIVSVSSIASAVMFPLTALYITNKLRHTEVVGLLIAASALIILKHHANIRRLLNGTEPKFTSKKAAVPADPIQVEKNA
jgi:glycerol-3-phosphate acyltransferase PlsY